MAEQLNVTQAPPIKIEDFFGDQEEDKDYDVTAFIDQVDKARTMLNWTDAQTVAFAGGYLKGPALTFMKTIKMDPEKVKALDLWSTFKPLLLQNFESFTDVAAAADVIKALKLKDKETYINFANRCIIAKRSMDQKLSDAMKISEDYKQLFRRDVISYFLNGIPDATRAYLMNHHENASLEDMAKLAAQYSKNTKENRAKYVQEMNMEAEEEVTSYVEAFNAQIKTWASSNKGEPFTFIPPASRRGRGGGGRSGAQAYGGGRGAANTGTNRNRGFFAALPPAVQAQLRAYPGYDPNKYLCFNCWTFSDHFASDCPNHPKDKPQELSLFNPPPRRGRGGLRGRGGRGRPNQENISVISPQAGNDSMFPNLLAGMQAQINTLTGLVSSQMGLRNSSGAGSDTESNYFVPPFPGANSSLNY